MTGQAAATRASSPASRMTKPLLVTGGAGFIGCNLADRLASEGHHVVVLDSLQRAGVEANLDWLRRRHPRRVSAVIADVRDPGVADLVADASGVFHLAAQVAVTTSLDDPQTDLDVNVRGTLNVLDAVRSLPRAIPVIFASTNKVYGDLSDIRLEDADEAYRPVDEALRRNGVGETRPLRFHTPYGCSKGAAEQYVLDFAHTFGLPTTVFRMSCIYGPRQCGTEDQGWVAHFLIRALERRPITIYGNGRQVRDILHVADAVEAYARAWRRIDRLKGRAFNLGGGPANAVSLREVLARIEELLGRPLEINFAEWRPGDQHYYISDTRRVTEALGLPKPRPWRLGISLLADWFSQSRMTRAEYASGFDAAQASP